ncbi:MAG: DUF2855 family protein [Acidimicrobiales bacterium]
MNFEVARDDLHRTRVVESDPAALADGEARLAVRRFGFSANNVTYAVFGDVMRYWSFFPAEQGWGRIPVWGFAEVVEANGSGLTEGELVYGYLPMGSELVAVPTRVGERGFTDASAHRAQLPAAYNGYTRCATDPVYDPDTEALQMLFRPLFMTDFVLDDWLADNDTFGAEVAVLSSASSKTAFGLAHLLARRAGGPEVVGLTSAGNVDFVDGLGVYDQVLTYDDIAALGADRPAVYIDMAGDTGVRLAVHTQMRGLTASVQVGGTHWEHVGGGGDLPGPTPALFFAPDQVVKRRRDWGAEGIDARFAEAWGAFLPVVADWIRVVERTGPDQVEATYREVLDGDADPADAFVLSVS